MTQSLTPVCRGCGEPVPPGADYGLCPRCVFAQAALTETGSPAAPPAVPDMGAVQAAFPHLEICSLIGSGGMGSVFKARQPQLDRFVALKILPEEFAARPGFAERFKSEAKALARLNHPNIVTIHDFGCAAAGGEAEPAGFYFLLMEFVDGVNLRQLLKTKRLSPAEALSVVPPVCEALQCAHEHGIVHRDIKPENILMDKNGTVKIADFGIARLLEAGPGAAANGPLQGGAAFSTLACGTPAYSAPEQVNGTADHRADIYSLGVVLYEMLTGERPRGKIEAPSRRVQVDIRIDEIVLRALETEPELRFATAAEFRTRVEGIRFQPNKRPRVRWAAAVVTLAVVTLAVAFASVIQRGNRAEEDRDRTAHAIPGARAPTANAGAAESGLWTLPEFDPPADTVPAALAQYEAALSDLLTAQKAMALTVAAPASGKSDRPRRALLAVRIELLQERVEEMKRHIRSLPPDGSGEALKPQSTKP